MANQRYRGKRDQISGDFIHVDLLPDVKRPRQFNINVIYVVLFAVLLSFLLIYWPLSNRQETLTTVIEENQDLSHELSLMRAVRNGLNLEPEQISLYNLQNRIDDLAVDYFGYYETINAIMESEPYNAQVIRFEYLAATNTFDLLVTIEREDFMDFLYEDLVGLPFVEDVELIKRPSDGLLLHFVLIVEVSRDVE